MGLLRTVAEVLIATILYAKRYLNDGRVLLNLKPSEFRGFSLLRVIFRSMYVGHPRICPRPVVC